VSEAVVYEGDGLLAHLQAHGVLSPGALDRFRATPLTGGVSSRIVLVEGDGRRLVAKQARARLTVAAEWFSDPARARREVACIDVLADRASAVPVPEIVWRDLSHDGYVMRAAPAGARNWKDVLLACELRMDVVEELARTLAHLHGAPLTAAERALFDDLTIFTELRLDPFYGSIAARHPDVAAAVGEWRADLSRHRSALVHGDFSPKTVLVWGEQLLLLDYEVAHWGDPAFDLAFMLCHLSLHGFTEPGDRVALRSASERLWHAYRDRGADDDELEQRVAGHYACLLLARIDGTSPVDHLRGDPARAVVRELALDLLRDPAPSLAAAFDRTEARQAAL
jgi:aminoglycoside phosphotransferase (APT) family kinase protein